MFSSQSLLKSLDFFVFDIAWSVVHILYCRKDKGNFSIAWNARVRLPKRSVDRGVIADMRSVILTLERGMRQATKWVDEMPQDVIFGVQSVELFADHIGMTYAREDIDAPISMNELDEMMLHIERRALERSEGKIIERWWALPTSLKLSASLLTHITLDGANLSNPLGFSGHLLRLNLLNVFAWAKHLNALSTIARHLNLRVISHLPAPLALSKWEQLLDYESHEGIMFLDLGSFTTQLTLMRDVQIMDISTLPIGTSSIEQALKKQFPKLDTLTIERSMIGSSCLWDPEQHEAFLHYLHSFCDILSRSLEDVILKNFSGLSDVRIFLSGVSIDALFPTILTSRLQELIPQKISLNSITKLYPLIGETLMYDEWAITEWCYATAIGLALAGCDLVDFREDPIISTLRKVIYQYA